MHQVTLIEVQRIFPPVLGTEKNPENDPACDTSANQSEERSSSDETEHNVSTETVIARREHNLLQPKSPAWLFYQRPLKSSSEPSLGARTPEWDPSQSQVIPQLIGLPAPYNSPFHFSGFNEEVVCDHSNPGKSMSDDMRAMVAGPAGYDFEGNTGGGGGGGLGGCVAMGCGSGGYPYGGNRSTQRHRRKRRTFYGTSAARPSALIRSFRASINPKPIPRSCVSGPAEDERPIHLPGSGIFADPASGQVHAQVQVAPSLGLVDRHQASSISHDTTETLVKGPHRDTKNFPEVLETPEASSHRESDPSSSFTDCNCNEACPWHHKITRKSTWYWQFLVLPDFCLLFLLFIAALIMEKYLDNYRWRTRKFPMTRDPFTGTWNGPVELSWQKEGFILPVLTATILIPLIPTLVMLAMQIWVRSFWDFNAAIFGLFKAIAIATMLQLILKSFISTSKPNVAEKEFTELMHAGEFRPNFMSVCNPEGEVFEPANLIGSPPAVWFVTAYECPLIRSTIKSYGQSVLEVVNVPDVYPTPWRVENTAEYRQLRFAMQSFPSGHTIEAFCVGVFLALYLNAKLKAFSDYHTSFWKLIVVMSPIVGALFIAASVVIDHNHHLHDVVLSIPIGVLVGLLAYRTHYISIFDYRTNHLHVPWSSSHRSFSNQALVVLADEETKQGYRFRSRFRHKTAVAWPRRPKYQSRCESQEKRIVGLDGARDEDSRLTGQKMENGRSKRSQRAGMIKRGKTTQSIFPIRKGPQNFPMTHISPAMTPAIRTVGFPPSTAPANSLVTSPDRVPETRDVVPPMTPPRRAAESPTPRQPSNIAVTSCDRVITRAADYPVVRRRPLNLVVPSEDRIGEVDGMASPMTPGTKGTERVTVDDWAHRGRVSDMV